MQTHTDYTPSAAFALLLIGPPKAGKTVAAMSFPDPYILDCDNNLAGALRYHNHSTKPFPFWFDNPGSTDPDKRWAFCVKSIKEAVVDPQPKTIIIDGLSLMAQYLEKHILANSSAGNGMKDLIIAGEKCMNQSHWMPFRNLMSQLVMACKSSGKLFVMTCHEHTETSESGSVIGYTPLISGQLRQNIAGYFTDVWRCETTNTAQGADYSIRFQPRSLMQIGNSLAIKDPSMKTSGLTRDAIWSKLSGYLQLKPAA